MHINVLTLAVCLVSVASPAIALPASHVAISRRNGNAVAAPVHSARLHRRSQRVQQLQQLSCSTAPVGENKQEAAAGAPAAGEEEAVGNEVEIESAFDVAVPVQGGDLKQDLVFTPSTVGKFEYEFQSATADEITVTENTAAGAPPAGFEAIEPNSYVVALAQSKGVGLTLSKIDYIFDPASAGLVGKDITKAQVGRLCPETGSFVISETLGELEFELEENEVTLNLNKNVTAEGEWGIFLPIAAAAAAPAAPAADPIAEAAPQETAAAAPEGKGKGKGKANGNANGNGNGNGRSRQGDDDEDDD